jgi:hypothetical protein
MPDKNCKTCKWGTPDHLDPAFAVVCEALPRPVYRYEGQIEKPCSLWEAPDA